MSAHIYIRTGDYPGAARANEAAVRADEALPKSEETTFYSVAYYGHNLHFLAVSNALAGNSARATPPRRNSTRIPSVGRRRRRSSTSSWSPRRWY
jgi:hypothetical protein